MNGPVAVIRRHLHMRRLAGRKLLREFDRIHPQASFVEIGANDGVKHDHLRPFVLGGGWRGVMVEPVPEIFERLRGNYAGTPGVAVENSAIGERDGSISLFTVATPESGDDALPDWYDTIGSVSRDVIASHADEIPRIEERIREITVPCLSFGSLLAKHGMADPDLVLIDTEGHDAAIVRGIDVASRRPRVLVYEHFHLPAADRARTKSELEGLDYRVIEEGFDSWCVDLRPDDGLTSLARRLDPGVPVQLSAAVGG